MRRIAAAVLFSSVGCSGTGAEVGPRIEVQPSDEETTTAAPAQSPVISKLVTRDHVLSVHAGDRFSVTTREGRLLSQDLSIDQLEARYAPLHEAYRTGRAEAGPYLDASLDR